eukprot:snap_masked-scaffold_29-processed-gene-2.46-mRNA-1 protein AED:0.16 eAED:0.18 QI:0/-1/0/1/-1/1/1/0/285
MKTTTKFKEIRGFGQVVVGASGAGKTTYCKGIKDILTQLNRRVISISLDPGNAPEEGVFDVDINELVNVTDVQKELHLGPNGSLVYCMEFLIENIDWLLEKMKLYIRAKGRKPYFLIDLPGQIELYSHHTTIKTLLKKISSLSLALTVINLVDAVQVLSPRHLVSIMFACLSIMLQLEHSQINLLTKFDLVDKKMLGDYGNVDTFDLLDLLPEEFKQLYFENANFTQSVSNEKFFKLRNNIGLKDKLLEILNDYNLVGFHILAIEEKDRVMALVKQVDNATGYFE